MRGGHAIRSDVLVAGGGLGGVAAALAALRLGRTVLLTEETTWLGGQLTSQAVAPDEHPWIEHVGCGASYRRLRELIRQYYRANYPTLPGDHLLSDAFNPGLSPVSRIAHEPRVAVAVIDALLARYRASRQLRVLFRHRVCAVAIDGDRATGAQIEDIQDGRKLEAEFEYLLDATEFGDVLDMAAVENVVGAESQSQTGERHARPGSPLPRDQQAVTACFAVDFIPGSDHTIARPPRYDFWRDYRRNPWGGDQLSWSSFNLQRRQPRVKPLFDGGGSRARGMDLWHYRRVLHTGCFASGFLASDVVLANWHQNDYWLTPLVGVSMADRARAIEDARQLSLSLLYWMQTEAPRHDGGYGYPELRMREDVTGTNDGLAMHVYVRESRRVVAETTILEQHISVEDAPEPQTFDDSVGIGYYNIDLHPSCEVNDFLHVGCHPFQIPLGALIPVRVENVLPACKNVGTTHVTNGAYRMHPVEWSIGEAAGALAAFCLRCGESPRGVRARRPRLREFQTLLAEGLGVPLSWPAYKALDRSLIASWFWPPDGLAPEDPGSRSPDGSIMWS